MTTAELIHGLRAMLTSGMSSDGEIRRAARAIRESGADIEIVASDDSPEALNGGDCPLWVTSTRRLIIDGEEVTQWTRCSVGDYGEMGRQGSEDEWCVSEDTDGGDGLPDQVAVALHSLGVEDSIPPGVPEPPAASEVHTPDPDGEFAVYWETVGDDERVVARYATLDGAEAVCAQRNREFSARNPGTAYLCGFEVRQLVDGEWRDRPGEYYALAVWGHDGPRIMEFVD